jgi:hypothetical protein
MLMELKVRFNAVFWRDKCWDRNKKTSQIVLTCEVFKESYQCWSFHSKFFILIYL